MVRRIYLAQKISKIWYFFGAEMSNILLTWCQKYLFFTNTNLCFFTAFDYFYHNMNKFF